MSIVMGLMADVNPLTIKSNSYWKKARGYTSKWKKKKKSLNIKRKFILYIIITHPLYMWRTTNSHGMLCPSLIDCDSEKELLHLGNYEVYLNYPIISINSYITQLSKRHLLLIEIGRRLKLKTEFVRVESKGWNPKRGWFRMHCLL